MTDPLAGLNGMTTHGLKAAVAALPTGEPFTLSEAAQCGVSRQQLRTLLRNGQVQRFRHGVFVLQSDVQNDADLALRDALNRVPKEAVLTGRAAADYLGIATPFRFAPGPLRFVLPSEQNGGRILRTQHVSVVRRSLPDAFVVVRNGIRMTSRAWTAMELALSRPLPEALIPLDSAMRLGVSRANLEHVGRHFATRLGRAALPTAIAEASPLAESALESKSRGKFLLAGLPRPELQVRVDLGDGRVARVDMAWRISNLVGEVDGLMKYLCERDYRGEKVREMQLRRKGLNVERWTNWDLDHDFPGLVARLRQYMTG